MKRMNLFLSVVTDIIRTHIFLNDELMRCRLCAPTVLNATIAWTESVNHDRAGSSTCREYAGQYFHGVQQQGEWKSQITRYISIGRHPEI